MITPRIDLVRHLALYTAFHRTPGNRLAHAIAVPVVLVSLMFVQAYLAIPGGGPLLHLATLLTLLLTGLLATIDLLGASLLFAFLMPWCVIAGLTSSLSPLLVVPPALVVHGLAWYASVITGHTRLEATIATDAGIEDSNLYFRRGYYLGRELGTDVSRLDALVQFCIAPLAVVHDLLTLVGARSALTARIEAERERVLARLGTGRPPLAER